MSGGRLVAGIVIAALIGVGLAFGVHQLRTGNPTTATNPTPSPATSPVATPASPSPSPSPSVEASPSAAATTQPTTAPTPAPTSTSTATAAAYPPQIQAGSKYDYNGSASLMTEFATDNRDVVSSACAGINDTNQVVPSGYQLFAFVSFDLADGRIVSSGWIKTSTGRKAFASIQDSNGSSRTGYNIDLAGGSHTFCVTHVSGGWNATVDGTTINSATMSDGSASSSGGSIQFHTSIANVGAATPVAQTLVIPGFHDITVGGGAPTRLVGGSATV